jgi:uncharacterized phage-associated protein
MMNTQPTLYRADKAIQVAARLLELRGGNMSYLKLIKLMYIIDRESLFRRGATITSDVYVSMKYGPVLSNTYSLICEGTEQENGWDAYIETAKHDVHLLKSAGTEALSEAECALIDEVFAQYGSKSRWELVEYVHTFPEWRNPKGSVVPITIEDMLNALNITQERQDIILNDLAASSEFDALIAEFSDSRDTMTHYHAERRYEAV